ncbi:MAG TPA: nuclear transport factor 2 family protein [Bryobacteraceae bacterium]|nr:nuclear transport factor 2 family protein [Bryobacteraceae bacterium]
MKFALAALLFALTLAAAGPDARSEKELTQTLETWRTAMLKGDAATLGRLYHPDLNYVHSSAKNETKAESIQNATKPDGIAKAIDLHQPTIHIYGDTAIVKATADFTSHAGAVSHLDILMVWTKTPSGWQLLARHATKIP